MTFHKKPEKNKRSVDALEAEKGMLKSFTFSLDHYCILVSFSRFPLIYQHGLYGIYLDINVY